MAYPEATDIVLGEGPYTATLNPQIYWLHVETPHDSVVMGFSLLGANNLTMTIYVYFDQNSRKIVKAFEYDESAWDVQDNFDLPPLIQGAEYYIKLESGSPDSEITFYPYELGSSTSDPIQPDSSDPGTGGGTGGGGSGGGGSTPVITVDDPCADDHWPYNISDATTGSRRSIIINGYAGCWKPERTYNSGSIVNYQHKDWISWKESTGVEPVYEFGVEPEVWYRYK